MAHQCKTWNTSTI